MSDALHFLAGVVFAVIALEVWYRPRAVQRAADTSEAAQP